MREFWITLYTGERGTYSREISVTAKNEADATEWAARKCRNGEWVGSVSTISFNQPIERTKLSGIDLL